MSEELQAEFDQGESGASNVYPAQCSSLRKNGYVVIKVSTAWCCKQVLIISFKYNLFSS